MTSNASWVGSMPEIYQSALGPALFEPFGPLLASTVAADEPSRVLELAAGTGIATAELVRTLPAAHVTATDLNPAMVGWGRAHVTGATWQVADAQQLPFGAGLFDAVACQFGVMFFPDAVGAFAEATRVLVPGGQVVMTAWDVVTASPFPWAMVESLRAVFGSDAPTFIERVPHGYNDSGRIAADLRGGGLEPEKLERVVLTGRVSDAATLARGFALGTPLRFALADLGGLDQLTALLAADMAARLGEGPLEADLAAWLIQARRN